MKPPELFMWMLLLVLICCIIIIGTVDAGQSPVKKNDGYVIMRPVSAMELMHPDIATRIAAKKLEKNGLKSKYKDGIKPQENKVPPRIVGAPMNRGMAR